MDCRKHNHEGYRGVCASCLRDKLSLLPDTTSYYSNYTINLYDDSSTTTTTVSSSPDHSPVKEYRRRSSSVTMSYAVREALSGGLMEALRLKKSKSVAHHVPMDSFIVKEPMKKTKKTKKTRREKMSGFWRKLFHFKGKGGDSGGLVASRQSAH